MSSTPKGPRPRGPVIGQASRALAGETRNGDQIAIVESADAIVVAVIDGLGHGMEAEAAATKAAALVRTHPATDLAALFRLCDVELRGSRGAAMTVLRIELATLRVAHAAVGNVEVASLPGSSFRAIALPGVIGGRFRKVVVTEGQLAAGDLLVIHTDGISRRLELEPLRAMSPQRAAEETLTRFAKETDDAACVVIRV